METTMTDYSILPQHMHDGARRYIENGIPPGDFMTAILANDFLRACGKADAENLHVLPIWARWVYNEIPVGSHGSYDAVEQWCARGGAAGIREAERAQATA